MLEIEEEDKEEAAVVVVDTVDPRLLLDTLFSSSTEVSNLPLLYPHSAVCRYIQSTSLIFVYLCLFMYVLLF